MLTAILRTPTGGGGAKHWCPALYSANVEVKRSRSEWTYRQTDRQTDRHTDTLIAILRTPQYSANVEVKRVNVQWRRRSECQHTSQSQDRASSQTTSCSHSTTSACWTDQSNNSLRTASNNDDINLPNTVVNMLLLLLTFSVLKRIVSAGSYTARNYRGWLANSGNPGNTRPLLLALTLWTLY